MRRFFVYKGTLDDDSVTIDGDLFRHLAKVLRLKTGSRLLLADGAGIECSGRISQIGKEQLTITIEERTQLTVTETGPLITLYQGLAKGDRMELILQKCTELGVAAVVPLLTSRSIPRPGERGSDRLERWRRIAQEAARQSKRIAIPHIAEITGFAEAINQAEQPLKLLLWEEERTNRLKPLLAATTLPPSIALLVGPEGGLSAEEAELAIAAGFVPITLGQRVLRTETAGLAMLAILQFYWGDLG